MAQLRAFLEYARRDRFYALWLLEATSGMRRCELAGALRDALDLDAGTLAVQPTRVVIDGRVVQSDGKTDSGWRVIALDPLPSPPWLTRSSNWTPSAPSRSR